MTELERQEAEKREAAAQDAENKAAETVPEEAADSVADNEEPMEQWLEVSVKVTHPAVEVVAEIFREAGARNGVVIDDPQLMEDLREENTWELCPPKKEGENLKVVIVKAYYPDDEELSRRLGEIEAAFTRVEGRIGAFRYSPTLFRTVSEKDWANAWKQYFHVTRVGKHFVIKPSWEKYEVEEGDVVLDLDPGMAFGTGTHPTTFMCLENLEDLVHPDTQVFDVGTGSGILAMAAAMLGATDIRAVDIDGRAVRAARSNIRKAGLEDRIQVKQGDLLQGTDGKADLIVANILADIIQLLLPDVPGKLKDDGIFLCSGIIKEAQPEITEAAEKVGLKITRISSMGDWVALQMQKK